MTPSWPLTPFLLRSQEWLYPRIILSKSHENMSFWSMWIQWPFFFKNLNQRSLTPRWHLTPGLLRSHVWLYPRIIVSSPMKIHHSLWIQWPFFKNLNQRSLTPRWPSWPLTPHLLRSHVWLYPRFIVSKSHGNISMYVMWIQWSIWQNTTYILRNTVRRPTTYRMSDHIFSFWTKFRRDKNA